MNFIIEGYVFYLKPRLVKDFRLERKYEIFPAQPFAPSERVNFCHRKLSLRAKTCFFSGARFRSKRMGKFSPPHAFAPSEYVNLKKVGFRSERWDKKKRLNIWGEVQPGIDNLYSG